MFQWLWEKIGKSKTKPKQIMWVTTMLIEKNNWTDDIDVTVGLLWATFKVFMAQRIIFLQ